MSIATTSPVPSSRSCISGQRLGVVGRVEVVDRDVHRPAVGRHLRLDAALVPGQDAPAVADVRVVAVHRSHAVVVMPVVQADGALPQGSARLGVERVDDAHLARRQRHSAAAHGRQDDRALEVPVVEVVRQRLPAPDESARAGVELDDRVAPSVRARAASGPRFFRRCPAMGWGPRSRRTARRRSSNAGGCHMPPEPLTSRIPPQFGRGLLPAPQSAAGLASSAHSVPRSPPAVGLVEA